MPWVRSYVRSDGTRVRGHSRWAPGAKRETMIFAVVALAVVGMGNSNISTGNGKTPRPQSTVQYPIRFEGASTERAPRPRPTVSYPIRWQR
ncbi:hypothetical protein Spa2297_34385 (plasmid) [Streptomyces parvulus]|uniref:Uncharacterized protein n=1 Tax=Streptomyces parvulus TaxID=146923 RepID=A0A191VB19_9ACTN|nr:hypothetical protein Spa2297_34385 [Streptomyces parvulus]